MEIARGKEFAVPRLVWEPTGWALGRDDPSRRIREWLEPRGVLKHSANDG
jgi:hypothetical protein